MREIFQAQPEAKVSTVRTKAHNVAKRFHVFRLAVSGQTHHLVFVGEFQEAEVLRHRAVVQTQRMRKSDGVSNLHAIAPAHSPHRTGKIAETVRGKQGCFFKWRNKEAAR